MKNILDKIEKELLYTPETTPLGKFKNIVFGAAMYITWATLILWIYKNTIPEFKNIELSFYRSSIQLTFFSMCVFAPLVEETLFRLGPLQLVKNIQSERITLIVILLSSIIFGYVHHGVWSIPVKGIAGILFCYVYLKNGYSYISSVFCHFLVNFYYFLK